VGDHSKEKHKEANMNNKGEQLILEGKQYKSYFTHQSQIYRNYT